VSLAASFCRCAGRLLLAQAFAGVSCLCAAQGVVRSAQALLAEVDALEKQGAIYQARRLLRQAAASLPEVPLLRRVAETEDSFGHGAAASYAALAEALERSPPQSPEYARTIERGLEVSLRDGEQEKAGWFAARLSRAGRPEAAAWLGGPVERPPRGVWVPGGLEALAFVARGKGRSSPERFFADYSRTLLGYNSTSYLQRSESLSTYFQRLAALEALGSRNGNRLTISLSMKDGPSRQRTEKVLQLLGWTTRSAGRGVAIEPGEKGSQAKRQETLSALGIDEIAMAEALESLQTYRFEIVSEWAGVLFGEDLWRSQFYPKAVPVGGLAEAMARDLRLARLYVGLSAMDEQTAAALLAGVGMKDLGDKYGGLLQHYSSALAVGSAGALAPGGEPAAPIWEKLVGVSPRAAEKFFGALLAKDNGRMAAFFFSLSQLDAEHQRFFTRSLARAEKFYRLFTAMPEREVGAEQMLVDSSFIEFFREIPLAGDGSVRFPGGPRAWAQAAASGNSPAAAPDEEEDILLGLARARYKSGQEVYAQHQNFLAVTRLNAHRRQPLDEASALLLSERYAQYKAAYPYFAVLTGLGQPQFAQFFALGERLRRYSGTELNVVMGQLHALIAILCLAQQSGRLAENQAADLFGDLCRRFAGAEDPADFTRASLDLVRRILESSSRKTGPQTAEEAGPDEAMRDLLLGAPMPVSFPLNGVTYEVDASPARRANYRRVMELQEVTSLQTLFRFYDAARSLDQGAGVAAQQIRVLEESLSDLLTVETPGGNLGPGKERKNLENFQPRRVSEILARLRRVTERPAGDLRERQALCRRLLAAIGPQAQVALAGILYSYFLNPKDLLVAEDPLLLRKHQFVNLTAHFGQAGLFVHSELVPRSERAGSYIRGGFASFGAVAGQVGTAGARLGDGNSEPVISAQLSSLRLTDGARLRDEDLRFFGLKIRAAREWIVRASRQPELHADLAEATLGLLSPSRRGELLAALLSRQWPAVWRSVTLGDLYFLADRYLERYLTDPWASPVTAALRQAAGRNDGSRLQELGGSLSQLYDCSHPHLLRLAPYEEYQRHLMPSKLAERSAEFKLYLAEYMDRAGISAAALGALAEPVARELFRKLRMNDLRDWQSVTEALCAIEDELLEGVLAKQ